MEEQKEKTEFLSGAGSEGNSRHFSFYKTFFWEAFLFSLTLGLGIFSACNLKKLLVVQGATLTKISFWQFLLYFLGVTLFIIFISYFFKNKLGKAAVYKLIFILAAAWGGLISLSFLIPGVFPVILTVILLFWWLKRPSVLIHNLLMILGVAGLGAILGLQLEPLVIVALLLVLSLYDFIAVYKTKHMVKLAKEMLEERVILAFIIPPKISDFKEGLKEVELGSRFLILGGGDIAFPLLLCVSLVPEGLLNSFIIFIFALIGLFVSFLLFTSQKLKKPMPALPPIALFLIIGFLITRIL